MYFNERENKKKQQQQQHQYKLYNNNDLEHNVMAFESEKVGSSKRRNRREKWFRRWNCVCYCDFEKGCFYNETPLLQNDGSPYGRFLLLLSFIYFWPLTFSFAMDIWKFAIGSFFKFEKKWKFAGCFLNRREFIIPKQYIWLMQNAQFIMKTCSSSRKCAIYDRKKMFIGNVPFIMKTSHWI